MSYVLSWGSRTLAASPGCVAVVSVADRRRRRISSPRVVTHEGRVIAHSPDGSGLAKRAPADKYPGSSIFYLPIREELEGVFII